MKIIKNGISKDKLKKNKNKTKRFRCYTCGCIFEADEGEYDLSTDEFVWDYYCKCPNCGERAFETVMRK